MGSLGFERICRTCMAESPALLSIFDNQLGAGDESTIGGMLRLFTTIDPHPTDGLPQRVCITCLSEINRAVSFKQKCERSENTLKSCLQQLPTECALSDTTATTTPAQHLETDPPEEPSPPPAEVTPDAPNTEPIVVEHVGEEFLTYTVDEMVYQCFDCEQTFTNVNDVDEHVARAHPKEDSPAESNAESVPAAADAEAASEDDANDANEADDAHDADDAENADDEDGHENVEYVYDEMLSEPNDAESDNPASGPEDTNETLSDSEDILHTSTITTNAASNQAPVRPVRRNVTRVVTTVDGQLAPHRCPRCGSSFVCERSLNIHLKTNKCTVQTFECAECARVFVHRRNLRAHVQEHHSADALRRTCTDCARLFATVDELRAHRSGGGVRCGSRSYVCTHCNKAFTMLSSLRDHLRTHSGERPFLCSICGKSFTQKTNLGQHMLRHTQTKPFQCERCPKSFVSKGERVQHMHTHTGEQPYGCEVCEAKFTTSSSLVKHRRIHTGERPYACEYCPMRFAALGTLKNHRRTHTGEKPFKCGQCDRTFTQRSDCVSHQRMHESPRLQCNFCDRSFARQNALKTHEQRHQKDGTDTEPAPATIEIQLLGADGDEEM